MKRKILIGLNRYDFDPSNNHVAENYLLEHGFELSFFEKEGDGQKIVWLVPNSQKNEMEPVYIEIEPNTTLQKDMPHEGEEFGYVLDGEIEIVIGNNVYKCKKRNSFYFVSNKVHYIKNTKNTTAKIIWVSSPPTF